MPDKHNKMDAFAYDDAFRTMEGEYDDYGLKVRFPQSGLLLRSKKKTPEKDQVLNKLTKKHESVNRKVGDSMGGKVLDLPILQVYHKGKDEGREEGREEGRAEGIEKGIEQGLAKGEAERLELSLEVERLRKELEQLKSKA